jgi:hypothetical protein
MCKTKGTTEMKRQVEVREKYSMDYSSKEQYAFDGENYFWRSQYRDPRYGYKMSAWKGGGQHGFNDERARPLNIKVRLPKA